MSKSLLSVKQDEWKKTQEVANCSCLPSRRNLVFSCIEYSQITASSCWCFQDLPQLLNKGLALSRQFPASGWAWQDTGAGHFCSSRPRWDSSNGANLFQSSLLCWPRLGQIYQMTASPIQFHKSDLHHYLNAFPGQSFLLILLFTSIVPYKFLMFQTPFQVCFPKDTTGTAIHKIMKFLILKLFFNSKNILENRRMRIILASDLSAAKQGVEITNQFP